MKWLIFDQGYAVRAATKDRTRKGFYKLNMRAIKRLGLLKVTGTYHFFENNAPALHLHRNNPVDKIKGALQAAYLLNTLHTINLLNGLKPFMVYFIE